MTALRLYPLTTDERLDNMDAKIDTIIEGLNELLTAVVDLRRRFEADK